MRLGRCGGMAAGRFKIRVATQRLRKTLQRLQVAALVGQRHAEIVVGLSVVRLQSQGFGESQPVAANTDEKGRLLNRRVEFVILSR